MARPIGSHSTGARLFVFVFVLAYAGFCVRYTCALTFMMPVMLRVSLTAALVYEFEKVEGDR